MLTLKDLFKFKMHMRHRINSASFLYGGILLLIVLNITIADGRQTRTSARVLAKQTGATQFEEERYEIHNDDCKHKHHLKKRSSDEDVDYEVYQGVVGRPGIDFPIYPRIPKTTFSCRSFGNGYFADMETDCQVFHICEEGRKISFLCPNGTIFQQSELTCDWWFKVNCLGSSGYYAESSEILNKQRIQRVRPSVPVQGFNIVGGGLNIKPKVGAGSSSNSRPKNSVGRNKSDRRMDSIEEAPLESVDFEDLSGEKQIKGNNKKIISNIEDNSNDNESQITAETASFVSSKHNKNFNYDKPKEEETPRKQPENRQNNRNKTNPGSSFAAKAGKSEVSAAPIKSQPNGETLEKARGGHRGQQRYKEDKKPSVESVERLSSDESKDNGKRVAFPEKIILAEKPSKPNAISFVHKSQFFETPTTPKGLGKQTSPFYPAGTYSTARRLETNTRTTPYYTPTVPSVLGKSKTFDDVKSAHAAVKGNKSNNGSGNISATTPSSLKHGSGAASGLFLESSAAPSVSSSAIPTTIRPFIIGMRHYNDANPTSFPEFFSTTTPAPTGPTYLPKGAAAPKAKISEAAGDLLLFAPIPAADDSVSRNVNEMLKTMSLIKHKLDDVEQVKPIPGREGLDIPPSSGPDALVSLAKYFAAEQSGASANSLTDSEKPGKSSLSNRASSSSSNNNKLSDSTVTITTEASAQLSDKADDIKASLLSNKTINKYNNLFGLEQRSNKQTADTRNLNTQDNSKAAFNATYQPFAQLGTTDATINQIVEKPDSRNIALVFSNALSNYLEDPEKFRQQLVSVRPTEPPPKSNFDIITEASLFKGGTAASYLPKKQETTTHSNIASEINSKFDYSTQLPDFSSTTEDLYDSTTYKSSLESAEHKTKTGETDTSMEGAGGEEFLQRGETQSFVKSRNEINAKSDKKKASKINAAYVKPTENPWNQISQTDFLDPLTINDGLMKETKATTASANAYLPKETTTTTPRIPSSSSSSSSFKTGGNQAALSDFGSRTKSKYTGSAELTTPRSQISAHNYYAVEGSPESSWQDIFTTYDIPRDTLPSSTGLQRIANKLFGGLNESEALHLKNVMQQADHNRQVLSLLLLLIQTCDDHNGKALERSRKHLLNALIDMDGKLIQGKSSHIKGSTTSSTQLPAVTTFRKGNTEDPSTSTLVYPSTTTDLPATSTEAAISEETTKFEIRVEDPEDQVTDSTQSASTLQSKSAVPDSSDKRALELLKSLYSLASKFTSRR